MNLLSLLLFAVGLNLVGFSLAYESSTDKLTDFSYGATFLVLAWLAFDGGSKHLPETLLLILIFAWAIRLSGFLVLRILRIDKDRRFDGLREDFWRFGLFWLGQAATAWVVMLPAIYFLRGNQQLFDVGNLIGWCLAVIGLSLEAIADAQKYNFNLEPTNDGKWIEQGLWKYSRHPNYFGEILTWLGVYIYCFSYLSDGQRIIAAASPLLISYLLIFVTGIPKLEKSADKKWGKRAAYRAYKARTSPLLILPRRRQRVELKNEA